MIQDSNIEVLDRIYYTPITPELVMRKGFEIEEQRNPSIEETRYIHKELDLELIQYDLVVARSGYPYVFTVKFTTPVSYSRNPTQMSTFNYSIYTYGQLLAVIEAKIKLNDLQKHIEVEVENINSTLYLANNYKISK